MKLPNRIAALAVLVATSALAQEAKPAPAPAPAPLIGSIASHPNWPVAKPEDVSSVGAIMDAVYNVISGPKGQPRDWDRMRSLFIPDARLIPARVIQPPQGATATHADAIILTIDGYIERSSGNMTTNGFFERGIHNEVEQFGNIVQVWSTYESRHNADDPTPFARGINSFQLLKDGDRYWVVNIFWDSERPGNPIPYQYLPPIKGVPR
jgi:hypothetical protein